MKLIFLDIDGVLNRNATREIAPSGCTFIEDIFIARLKRICNHTGAHIVLSSSWREGWYAREAERDDPWVIADYEALEAKLYGCGLSFYDYTPMHTPGNRAAEILQYIEESAGVEDYVILDDLRLEGVEAHHVRTHPKHGLTDEDVIRAIAILNHAE